MPERVMIVLLADHKNCIDVSTILSKEETTEPLIDQLQTMVCSGCGNLVQAVPNSVRCPYPNCSNNELLD